MIKCGVLSFTKKISAKDGVQDINLNFLKIKVNETYKKDEKIITDFKPSDKDDVKNKAYLHAKLCKI